MAFRLFQTAKPEQESQAKFEIDTRPRLITLPDIKEHKKINVRYPLIPPYAFAHIFWDEKENELAYFVEEPVLTEVEKEVLKLIQLGLEEMINISFVKNQGTGKLIEYLEKNVQSILIELGTKVSRRTYFNLMYYIYRDSVGLNQVEPLLNDYYIEDIECNGVGFPIYIVHRKYENMRTNIMLKDLKEGTDFVEKLAQRAGRYVSYAKPLLDGSLPDGSRVNATYSDDVTTRGPTFTVRKFTKEPWTPTHLIKIGTANAEIFAFMWLAIEHKFNVMVIGETASGKTTFLNAIVDFIPFDARICSIEDTRELNLMHDNWLPSVSRMGFGIPNILGTQYGGVTLFDLLRESFRQNPDYVIVGEVRGAEASVLFQGMASGHPSFGTFHAGSVETLVRRLETPPINLSASLVASLDIVCIAVHAKLRDRNIRRIQEVDEILQVHQELGKTEVNPIFDWDPIQDIQTFNAHSSIFKRVIKRTGISPKKIFTEFKIRVELLKKLAERNITNFADFGTVVKAYYQDPDQVLEKFGINVHAIMDDIEKNNLWKGFVMDQERVEKDQATMMADKEKTERAKQKAAKKPGKKAGGRK